MHFADGSLELARKIYLPECAECFGLSWTVDVLDDSSGSYCATLREVSQQLGQGKVVVTVSMGDEYSLKCLIGNDFFDPDC